MRIDYFLVGEGLKERIKVVRIHGRGEDLEGESNKNDNRKWIQSH